MAEYPGEAAAIEADIAGLPDDIALLKARGALATGIIAQSLPRWAMHDTTTAALVSGTPLMTLLYLPAGPVSNLSWVSSTTALTRGSNADSHLWAALCDTAGNVLAVSADDTSGAWGASAVHTIALGGGGFTVVTPGFYYAVVMVAVGTGGSPAVPSLVTMAGVGGATAVLGLAPALCVNSTSTGRTTPPAVSDVLALSASARAAVPYCYAA